MTQIFNDKPIGLFDSGVGGLTVLREIAEILPEENIIYLGDTARVPYGPKNPDDVKQFVLEISGYLRYRACKLIVIACNTGTATGLESAANLLDIPVMGVIEPGAQLAVQTTRNGKVGVIGTVGTVNSGSYKQSIQLYDSKIEVFSQPCHRFVDFIEEGIVSGPGIHEEVRAVLKPLIDHNVDTLILGCTHYPLIENIISDVMGDNVRIISSAKATALKLKGLMTKNNGQSGRYEFLSTADPGNFKHLGSRFLGQEIYEVKHVSLDKLKEHSLSNIEINSPL